jgi:hypothetical protein
VSAAAIEPADVPRIAEGARFVPQERLGGAPHVVVDGPRMPGTVLALSHWPDSGTPEHLAADTSALIADAYLRRPGAGQPVEALTTNHYDEDGLLAIWLLLERPPEGAPERALALAAAEAGDFGTWTDPWAARVAIAAMAMAERGSPFPEVGRALAGARGNPAGALYEAVLPRTGPLLADPERHRMLWASEWEGVESDIALLEAGEATLEEEPAADVAIVRAPRPLHDMAVHPRTGRTRVLTAAPDGTLVVGHRYETWVRYVSRPLPPRVDLSPLAQRLQELEERPGTWVFEGVRSIRPRLFLAGPGGAPAPSSIGPERLVAELAGFLEARGT